MESRWILRMRGFSGFSAGMDVICCKVCRDGGRIDVHLGAVLHSVFLKYLQEFILFSVP